MSCRDAGSRHDGCRRGQAECARAGDHQHGHGVQDALLPSPGCQPPAEQCQQRKRDHDRHEHRAHTVDESLDRRLRGLRGLDHPHDARQGRLRADGGGAHDQKALCIDRSARHTVTDLAHDRQALAGDQRFVDLTCAFGDDAVDGHAFAGANHDHVVESHLVDRGVGIASVAPDPRGLGAQGIQGLDRLGRLPFRARLQPLAEQHEGDHDRRGLEVEMRRVGGTRPQQLEHTQPIAGGRAERDQQVHVAGAGAQCLPACHVKACAEPELHRRGQRELQPAIDHPVPTEQHAEHRHHQWGRQRRRHGDRPPGRLRSTARRSRTCAHGDGRRIARGLHRSDQRRHRVGRPGVLHLGHFGCEIDLGREHPIDPAQRLLDARRARRAGHAVDLQADRPLRQAIASPLHRGLQRRDGERFVTAHRHGLGRQVHVRRGHARDIQQGLLDPRCAGSAGHALDAERQIVAGCSRRSKSERVHWVDTATAVEAGFPCTVILPTVARSSNRP